MDPDSQYVPLKILLLPDSLNPCRLNISAVLTPGGQFRLDILPGMILPVHHNANDSMAWNFSANPAENYGNLKVNIEDFPANSVFILTDDKGKPRYTWHDDSLKIFTFLPPGKFRLMLFIDENKNGKWDAGRYLAGKQPEKVLRYDKEISIRANWDLEVIWKVIKQDDD